ncbi:MAG: outer membrane lipoprotein-sorting protein [Thermodesulfobacteriota bacterium]|nr:outer membrane lipoprotein-sorting protein [Thermodesulfobacteriota bacterium]
MKGRRIQSTILLGVFLIIYGAGSTFAEDSGNAILQEIDEITNAPLDEMSDMRIILLDKKGNRKERLLKTWAKYFKDKDSWRIIKFLSPTDVRGVGFLVLAEDKMYLYLPAFHRIRRIASHSKKESFMGSDLSFSDMETKRLCEDYEARLLKEDSDNYFLELIRRPGSEKPYFRIKMTVEKSSNVPIYMESFDEGNNLWKVWKMTPYKSGKYYTVSRMEVEEKKKEHVTIVERENIQFDQGLEDKIFTQRFLKRRPK